MANSDWSSRGPTASTHFRNSPSNSDTGRDEADAEHRLVFFDSGNHQVRNLRCACALSEWYTRSPLTATPNW